jgi:hypothetical protein
MRGLNLAHGLAGVAWPSGKTGPWCLGHSTTAAHPRRGHHAWGRRGGAALAETPCGLLGGHPRGEKVAPSNQRGGRTHLSGLSMAAGGDEAAWWSSSRAAALR